MADADEVPSMVRTESAVSGEPLWQTTATLLAVGLVGLAAGLGFAHQQQDVVKIVSGALAVVLGAGLAVVAARRFEAFLLVLFAIRPVLDSVKDSSGGSSFTPGVAIGLVFLVAAVLWLVARRRIGRLVRPGAVSLAAIALVAAAVLSILASKSYNVSLQATLKLASGLVMFLVLEQLTHEDPRKLRSYYVATCGVTILSSVVAIVEGVLRSSPDGRIRGLFVHENDLAEYTVTVVLLMIALRPHLSGGLRRLTDITIVLALPALYLTYARGAWLGFVLGIMIIGILQSKRLLAGMLVALVAALVLVPGITARFSDLKDKRVHGAGDPNSFAFRERYWQEIAPLANSTPVIGIGLDMVEHSTPDQLLPHNTPLQVWIETGAVGSVAFLWLCSGMAVGLRGSLRRVPAGATRGWVVGGTAAAACFGLQMLTDNLLLQALQLWYLGLAVAPALTFTRTGVSPFAPATTDDAQDRAPTLLTV